MTNFWCSSYWWNVKHSIFSRARDAVLFVLHMSKQIVQWDHKFGTLFYKNPLSMFQVCFLSSQCKGAHVSASEKAVKCIASSTKFSKSWSSTQLLPPFQIVGSTKLLFPRKLGQARDETQHEPPVDGSIDKN